jgi:nitrate reductase delta subunit
MTSALLTQLAGVLEYPGDDFRERCTALKTLLEEVRPEAARELGEFTAATASLPSAGLEEAYSATFDLNTVCCLYVGYQLFGESYKRGALMAKLNAEYRELGHDPGNELPDHLSVVLRYLAALDDPDSQFWLLEEAVLPALWKMKKAFDGTDNMYGALLRSVMLALQPPDYVPPRDARELPVLEPVDHSFRE